MREGFDSPQISGLLSGTPMRCFRPSRLLAVTAASLLLCVSGVLQAKPHAKHRSRDQVVALENLWVKAQIQGDPAAMDKLLSPDFLGITASGEVVTKAQQLDRMRNRTLVIQSLTISDVRVKLLGEHAASVTCLAQINGTADGHPLVGSFRYTHVYQRQASGAWTITNFEATRIPGSGRAGAASPTEPGGTK